MKKLLLMATALLFACTADLFAQITWHGTGTKDNPYLIESAAHFRAINTMGLDNYYKQTADIDLGSISANNTTPAYVVGNFTGNYDGNGKSITYQISIQINDTDENKNGYIGLFDTLSGSAVVKNLTIRESNISFTRNESGGNSSISRYMGFICGRMMGNATISNCCINDSRVNISGFYGKIGKYVHVAGAVGSMEGGTLQGISYSCEPTLERPYTLDGLSCVGGMVANLVSRSKVVIERCLFRGSLRVQGFNSGSCANVGGIAGRVQADEKTNSIVIRNCYVDATAIVSENTSAYESAAAGIAVLARSVNLYNCYANIGRISVVPDATYNAAYPLSGKVNDGNSESNRTFRAGCENSGATVKNGETIQYYHTQSAGSVAPLLSQTSNQLEMQDELVYLGDDFVEVCSPNNDVRTCKIELKSAIKGHIYSNQDGDFTTLTTWQNYVDPALNPNVWQNVQSIDIKNKVTIRSSANNQIALGSQESRLPIKIRKDAALILENGHNINLSNVDITIEDGGSFVNGTTNDMKGVITKEIYPDMWNFIGMAGHQNMEPLHDAYNAAQPFDCLRFWALKYDYGENMNMWNENNYLRWDSLVAIGEGVLIYTNGNNVFVNIDDKTNDDNGEQTPTVVNFVNTDITITKNVGQNTNGNWLALANPYPARLDVSKVLSGIANESNEAIQGECVYVRDGKNPVWTIKSSGTIEAAQGFFVNFASSGEKSVTLKKNMLANYPQQSSESPSKSVSGAGEFLRVSVASEGYRVPVMYRQNDAASAEYDIFDADKLFGSGTVAEPYFALGERMLCKQEADSTHFVADLNIRSEQSRSVEIIAEYIPEGYTLSLIDDNNETEMNQDDVYTADIARGDNEGRFKLVINKNNVSIEDVANVEEINFYNNNRQITISGGNIKLVQVYNTLGQKVYETKQRTFTLDEVASGTYIVNVQTDETSFSNKIVVH
ncbi:MAG: T9SS type A sorting domain-containing protein [Bacteroidales bacterium]|nr:T9SS type A sorting domain-containing protein [Bacteroidales bacterium]MDY5788783.1 T9SS type A sorting domain-containing protein [Candidatus Onthomorpha sp.]